MPFFALRISNRSRAHLCPTDSCCTAYWHSTEFPPDSSDAILQNATSSAVLRCLCDQILGEELRHVQFQAEQLDKLRSGCSLTNKIITVALQQFLYCGTVLIVWIFHQRVIRRGGYSCLRWWTSCWHEFNAVFAEPPPNDLSQPTRIREDENLSTGSTARAAT